MQEEAAKLMEYRREKKAMKLGKTSQKGSPSNPTVLEPEVVEPKSRATAPLKKDYVRTEGGGAVQTRMTADDVMHSLIYDPEDDDEVRGDVTPDKTPEELQAAVQVSHTFKKFSK
jgi:hypothetical protein